ncbi:MAG: glycosyltransferase [Bacteroidaceae bacterium]|nr:glycosyltransferase [Bacteroidaceae bacterium]
MCKVSIIIPIYNAEKYIQTCIDSITSQSYNDWELILVNDGSKDASLLLCRDYAEKYPQIHVFTKENGGVSSARNLGLQKAQGDYVLFVDVDDYLSEDFFCFFQDYPITEDVVFLQYKCFDNNGNISEGENIEPVSGITDINQIHLYFSKWLHQNIMRTPWGKLIKRDIIHNKSFPIGQTIGEDSVFMFSILAEVKSIRTVDNSFYMWRTHADFFIKKYQLPVEKSIEYLCNIYNAYSKIGTPSPHLETTLYITFYSLSKKSMSIFKWKWFSRPIIRELWESIDYDYKYIHKKKFKIYGFLSSFYQKIDKNKFNLNLKNKKNETHNSCCR